MYTSHEITSHYRRCNRGNGGYVPPTLKSRGTSYVLPPPLYHNIYFDWLVPPTYKIVPAPLIRTRSLVFSIVYILCNSLIVEIVH